MRTGIVITPDDLRGFDWVVEAAGLGFNTLGIHNGGVEAAGKELASLLAPTLADDFRKNAAAHKIDVEFELHTGSLLLPRKLFAEHPEYFPLNGWNRRIDRYNFCPSSAALQIVGENAAQYGRMLLPDTKRHFFWGDDCAEYCHCDKCAHYNWADQAILGANAIGRELAKDNPRATTAFLAYLVTMEKPLQVRPEANVFLEFAPVRRCYRHAICDRKCSINVHYCQVLLELLEIFPAKTTHILEYYLDSSLFSNYRKPALKPEIPLSVIREDVNFYRSLGIESISTFAVFMDGEYFARHGRRELDEYARILNV